MKKQTVRRTQKKVRKELLFMSEEEFRNALFDAILMDNKRTRQMFVKNNQDFIKKMKKLVNPQSIIKQAEKEIRQRIASTKPKLR
jgi:hypothetical protein